MTAPRRNPSRRRPGAAPGDHVSLSRVGVTGVEKVIRIRGRRAASSSSTRSSNASSTSTRTRRARTCRASRRRSTRRSTRSCSNEAFKAETLAAHIAERVRERQDACAPRCTIAARYPEHKPAPGQRRADAGDLHAVRLRGRVRARHPPARRRAGAGHDRLPVRAGDGRRPRRASGWPPTASPTTRSSASSSTCRWRPTTSAASARSTSAAPSAATARSRPRRLLRIVEESMSSEIYELMKRPDEVEVVERRTAARASSRTACARRSAWRSTSTRASSPTRSCMSRQENLETIHQHNVVAERYGLLGELAGEAAERRARRCTT